MRPTFHLTPAERWSAADRAVAYAAPSLESEGFIHCTDGAPELLASANRHYAGDPRPFVVLTVDLDATGSPWRVEDPSGIYPHIFGPIERVAILEVQAIERDPGGRFVAIVPAAQDGGHVGHEASARPSA